MTPTTPDDDRLRDAWADFCKRLQEAGELVFRETAPATPLDRATGFQYLARYITKALHEKFEFDDPEHPQLWHLQTPTHKSFGDNPDCTYLVARIDGSHTYRIVGNRGTVQWVSFLASAAALNNADLEAEWDGSFELWLGPDDARRTGSGQGPARPGVRPPVLRDWDTEEPMRIRIERVGVEPAASRSPSIGSSTDSTHHRWSGWSKTRTAGPTGSTSTVTVRTSSSPACRVGPPTGRRAALGRLLHFCYWQVQPDEALVIRVTPPGASTGTSSSATTG